MSDFFRLFLTLDTDQPEKALSRVERAARSVGATMDTVSKQNKKAVDDLAAANKTLADAEERRKQKQTDQMEEFLAVSRKGMDDFRRQHAERMRQLEDETAAQLKANGQKGTVGPRNTDVFRGDPRGRAMLEIEQETKDSLKMLERDYQLTMARIQQQLAQGFLKPKDAHRLGVDAARAYNQGLAETMTAMTERGKSTGVNPVNSIIMMGQSFKQVDESSSKASLGLGRLRYSMTSLAANMMYMNPLVGRVASTLGAFALGSGYMIAVLAGLAALGEAWRLWTQDATEAKDLMDKMHQMEGSFSYPAKVSRKAQLEQQRDEKLAEVNALANLQQNRVPSGIPGLDTVLNYVTMYQSYKAKGELKELEARLATVRDAVSKDDREAADAQTRDHAARIRNMELEYKAAQQIGMELEATRIKEQEINALVAARLKYRGQDTLYQREATMIRSETASKLKNADIREQNKAYRDWSDWITGFVFDQESSERAFNRQMAEPRGIRNPYRAGEEQYMKKMDEISKRYEKLNNDAKRDLTGDAYATKRNLLSTQQTKEEEEARNERERNKKLTTRQLQGEASLSFANGAIGFISQQAGPMGGVLSGIAQGAMSGNPYMAAANGAMGLIEGLVELGSQARRTREEFRQFTRQLGSWTDNIKVQLGQQQSVDAKVAQAKRDRDVQLEQTQKEYKKMYGPVYQQLYDPLAQQISQLTDDLIKQLKEQDKYSKEWYKDSLKVRELQAGGNDIEAEKLRLQIEQEKELNEARLAGMDKATLATLEYVQAKEREAAAAKNFVSEAMNIPTGYRIQAALFKAIMPRVPNMVGEGGLPMPTGITPQNPIGHNPGEADTSAMVVLNVDGRELARGMVRQLRKQSAAQFGTEVRWSEVTMS